MKLYEQYLNEQEWECPDCGKKWSTKRDKPQCKCFACGQTIKMKTNEDWIANPIVAKYMNHQYDVPKTPYDKGPKNTGNVDKVQGIANTLPPELWKVQDAWNKFVMMASAVAPDMKDTFQTANTAITKVIDDLMSKCKKVY